MSNTVPKENDYCAYFDSAGFSSLKRISDNYFIAPDVSGTWRDSPQSEVTALVDQINSGSAWRDVVYRYTDQKSTEWLEKVVMSPSRSLFLELFDFSKVNSVLDFGSGWGQLTRPLASRVPFVMSVEPNQERLMVNEAISRQEGFDNICYLQASDVSLPLKKQSFDLILLCGVYEWLACDGTADVKTTQEQALKTLSSLLTPGGKVIIAIENRVGLKYLLGERDDHSGKSHISCLPYQEARAVHLKETNQPLRSATYDIKEYEQSLSKVGFKQTNFYLAFPDYKITQVIIPAHDEIINYFVNNADLPTEHDGSDGSPSRSCDVLGKIYRSVNNLDLVKYVAPSFIIEANL